MDFSDSMFLIEIAVESLRSFISCKEFRIRMQFADVFTSTLENHDKLGINLLKLQRKNKMKKTIKVRKNTGLISKFSPETKMLIDQSILFPSKIDTLLCKMNKCPIELTLYEKVDPGDRMGSTHIYWNKIFLDYLKKLYRKPNMDPPNLITDYIVFDEVTSKQMATIKLNIKLTHLKDRFTTRFKSISEEQPYKFKYTHFNSKDIQLISTTTKHRDKNKETDVIKKSDNESETKLKNTFQTKYSPEDVSKCNEVSEVNSENSFKCVNKIINTTNSKSTTELNIKKCHFKDLLTKQPVSVLKYIFGDEEALKNKVYCVGYFIVENESSKIPNSSHSENSKLNTNQHNHSRPLTAPLSPSNETNKNQSMNSQKLSTPDTTKYRFKLYDCKCQSNKHGSCVSSISLELPTEADDLITVKNCVQIDCDKRKVNKSLSPADDRILLDLKNLGDICCVTKTVEDVVGGVKANVKMNEDPCFCSCECQFRFSTKKTTYCSICKGFELAGQEITSKPKYDMAFPCPVFHKLIDKGKLKNWSTSGSDSRKKEGDLSQKSSKSKTASEKKISDKQIVESEKDTKKGKKSDKKDARFKFNYGYTGIPPKIGHCNCAGPCTGTLGSVPKNMGWLWTAEDVPGIKFRPMWKPGASNKHVVRLLKMARNPGEVITKKRKKIAIKKKSLKRPLLIVHKKDGEFTITMETMKIYPKPRAVNQVPYEEKPVLTYTIGRTEEENRDRQRRKEKAQRRMERAQREFIQSTFRDVCREICLKTYQQALGILPNSEDLECPCLPAQPGPDVINIDASCSCSEEDISVGSDTDSDEWIVEFTAPVALYDPKCKIKKVTTQENMSQYSYLDYRVKLLDRYGNQVPRFFKGPCGKQQCSDLGGFWSPDHKWLEINIDGYIAPDGKWAPYNFIGPNGEQVEAEAGKFQSNNGKWLVVGVDGYVDCQNKWRYYSKPKQEYTKTPLKKYGTGDKYEKQGKDLRQSEATWSCFGDVSPRVLSKIGIVGHGTDKKRLHAALKDLIARGEDIKLPVLSIVPRLPPSKRLKKKAGGHSPQVYNSRSYFLDREKCKHSLPSDKGITAVNEHGNKTYFRLKDYRNRRPKERLHYMKSHGISVSSFHVPCFSSFISSDAMKKQLYDKLQARLPERNMATQT